MEDSSHELIEQLISEEKYCYGFDTNMSVNNNVGAVTENQEPHLLHPIITTTSTNSIEQVANTNRIIGTTIENESMIKIAQSITTTTTEDTVVESNSKKVLTSSKEFTSTHNKRWNEDEDKLLADAVKMFGYGSWKIISDHVKTRNPTQCKSRARQKLSRVSQQQKVEVASEAIITQGSELKSAAVAYNTPTTTPPSPIPEVIRENNNDIMSGLDNNNDNNSNPQKKSTIQVKFLADLDKNVSTSVARSPEATEKPSVDIKEETEDSLEIELELDPQEITDHERSGNTEWFLGKGSKSPERYMRIRNHIIECWKKMKPNYLTKTAGRRALTDCGDVNAVGRIHTYLESVHAINTNCKSPVKRTYGRSAQSSEGSPNRKKAKKTPGYFWADVEDDEENEDAEKSNIIKGDGVTRPRRTAKKPETFYSENNESGHSHDPFTLVPVSFYSSEKNAPFTVKITSEALLVMDFHSHLAYTEVIGLLGGKVLQTEAGLQELHVEHVFPCRSASTGIQCEMDPVSEMAARELFEQKGLSVVGWYHSHPTFEPEPSIRDIENQASYQDLFRDEMTGLEPFIGVIITPYNSRNTASDKSQIRFIHISKNWNTKNNYRLPFACFHKVTPSKGVSEEVVGILRDLILEYKEYEHKIDMSLQYGQVSRLDKLISSIKCHLFMNEEAAEQFISNIRRVLQQNNILNEKPLDDVVNSLAV